MSIFERIRDIIDGRVNDLLEGLEDPIQTVNQMIREIEHTIVRMRRDTSASLAMEKLTETRLERTREEIVTWQENAELGVREARDELARKALAKKQRLTAQLSDLEQDLVEHRKLTARLRDELHAVEDKVQELRRKRETLITKRRAAETRRRLRENIDRAAGGLHREANAETIIDGYERFRQLEEAIDRQIAEVDAADEVQQDAEARSVKREIDELKSRQAVDEELEQLKKKAKKK